MVGDTSGDGDEYDAEDQELLYTDYDFSEQYEAPAIPDDVFRKANELDRNLKKRIEAVSGGENRPSMHTTVPSMEAHSLIDSKIEGREPLEASQNLADSLSSTSFGKKIAAPMTSIAQNVSTAKVSRELDILDEISADDEGSRIPSNTLETPKTKLNFASVSTPSREHHLITSRSLGVATLMIPDRKASQLEALQPPSKQVFGLNTSTNDPRQHVVAKNEEKKGVDDDDFDAWMDSI